MKNIDKKKVVSILNLEENVEECYMKEILDVLLENFADGHERTFTYESQKYSLIVSPIGK